MLSYKVTKEIIKILTFPIFLSPIRKKVKDYLKYELFDLPYRRQKEFYNYVAKYCSETAQNNNKSTYISPHKLPIWQIWFQGEKNAPKIVKLCFESVEKYCSGRKIVRLTEKNYHDYIKLPEYIIEKYKKGIISLVHLSDIIRVCLLAKYGGTWIDATVLLTHNISPQILQSNFFAFHITKESSWFDCHSFLTSASWFMHSQPNNNLICSLRNALFEYWKNENKIIDYFLIYFIFKCLIDQHKHLNKEWNSTINLIEEPTHKMQLSFKNNFCLEELKEIKNNSSIHKLTYRYKERVTGSLLDIFLKEKDLFY
ncbi:hypothetical protein A9G43_07665 [Gilliamella sp. Occ3-1]|uniref:capsular polysaccharide synthesis protein n=1 Tax=Gilliamella sp. Occ3-1 TaxID=3120253 RepID=UPI00080DE492|nr:capsular polysaccharide synthesis protein [Gilliamella apicola]OCG70609.1 hypothetical protein A9G43_07665 [Gilliamella apicola]